MITQQDIKPGNIFISHLEDGKCYYAIKAIETRGYDQSPCTAVLDCVMIPSNGKWEVITGISFPISGLIQVLTGNNMAQVQQKDEARLVWLMTL